MSDFKFLRETVGVAHLQEVCTEDFMLVLMLPYRPSIWIHRPLCPHRSQRIHTNLGHGTWTSLLAWKGPPCHDPWFRCWDPPVLQEFWPPSLWSEIVCNRPAWVCKEFSSVLHSWGRSSWTRVRWCNWEMAERNWTWKVYSSRPQPWCISFLFVCNDPPLQGATPDSGWSVGSCRAPEQPRLGQKSALVGGSCGLFSDQVQPPHPCQDGRPPRWAKLLTTLLVIVQKYWTCNLVTG